MSPQRTLSLAIACVLPLFSSAACDSSPATTASDAATDVATTETNGGDAQTDAADASEIGDAVSDVRTLVHNPLFGDVHPQNLFIDPNFSVRSPGLGDWQSQTGDTSQTAPSLVSSLMSDSPDGIAFNVAQLADATKSTSNFELSLVAQVPGGPGPYHLHVWLSTLDAATSAAPLTQATFALLTSLDSSAIDVTEDPTHATVIAGRTWHLYDATITQDLSLGGFVLFDFKPTKNTWLLQAPEFVPVALEAKTASSEGVKGRRAPMLHPLGHRRPMTTREHEIVSRYTHTPRPSVPAGHPSLDDEPRAPQRR